MVVALLIVVVIVPLVVVVIAPLVVLVVESLVVLVVESLVVVVVVETVFELSFCGDVVLKCGDVFLVLSAKHFFDVCFELAEMHFDCLYFDDFPVIARQHGSRIRHHHRHNRLDLCL